MELSFRRARAEDVPDIVRMLADDEFGAGREGPIGPSYESAFAAIDADPRELLVVAELDGRLVGTLQLSLLPSMTLQGGWRAQIEGVRVDSSVRGGGVGAAMVDWAVSQARARGCVLVQLTTNKARTRARAFYERLGFVASHEGMTLPL